LILFYSTKKILVLIPATDFFSADNPGMTLNSTVYSAGGFLFPMAGLENDKNPAANPPAGNNAKKRARNDGSRLTPMPLPDATPSFSNGWKLTRVISRPGAPGAVIYKTRSPLLTLSSIPLPMRSATAGQTRWARSYGIVDHQLLHGRYLHRMSPETMSLYLFLCVVSDSQGKSFYGERTVMDILRLNAVSFQRALGELKQLSLVDYRRPYFRLSNLDQNQEMETHERRCGKDKILKGSGGSVLAADCPKNKSDPPQSIAALFRQLSGQKI
jgi:hypothetical protein